MAKKKIPQKPFEVPGPNPNPEIQPDRVPEEPIFPEEEPEINPEKEPTEPSPIEIPPPGVDNPL
jgi:hypothetical protein